MAHLFHLIDADIGFRVHREHVGRSSDLSGRDEVGMVLSGRARQLQRENSVFKVPTLPVLDGNKAEWRTLLGSAQTSR
jgi:hypothetical protein